MSVCFLSLIPPPPSSTLFPYTTLFRSPRTRGCLRAAASTCCAGSRSSTTPAVRARSEEHTSELQSPYDLVCRLLLEKKKQRDTTQPRPSRYTTSATPTSTRTSHTTPRL